MHKSETEEQNFKRRWSMGEKWKGQTQFRDSCGEC